MRIGMLTLCVLAMGLLVGACNKSDKKAQKKSCDALCTRFNVTCAKENMLLTIKDNDTYKKAKPDKQKLPSPRLPGTETARKPSSADKWAGAGDSTSGGPQPWVAAGRSTAAVQHLAAEEE